MSLLNPRYFSCSVWSKPPGAQLRCSRLGQSLGALLALGLIGHVLGSPASATIPIAAASKSRLTARYGCLPLTFEVNQGQCAAPVKFLARGQGYNLFLTGTEAVLSLKRNEGQGTRDGKLAKSASNLYPLFRQDAVLRMKLLGANPHPVVCGQAKMPGTSNYFIGTNKAKWHTCIANYGRVRYSQVYRGVDLVYYGQQRQLEYDLNVAPGADPQVICLGVQGARRVWLNRRGELVLETGSGRIVQHAPMIYQTIQGQQRTVPGGYRLETGHRVGFIIGAYDHTRPLIIDPTLSYSTFLGGSNTDQSYGIAVDSSGNAYVTGYTEGSFPTTSGTYQPTFSGNYNAFVSKFNSTGTALLYSTYLGGIGNVQDFGYGIAVDSSGDAYVTGYTSGGFPTTSGAYQTAYVASGGNYDAFVSKLNSTGTTLLYSTYVGGSGNDESNGIALDTSGNAYIVGFTTGSFPTTSGAYQTTFVGGNYDTFVSKLNSTGTALLYSTYLGSPDDDFGFGIAVDSSGNAYVTGNTDGSFPITSGASQTAHGADGGSYDVFVSKLNNTGSGLVYSTYLGGNGSDRGNSIALDSSGDAYITGFTQSTNFPTTSGAYRTTFGNAGDDAFVSKLNSTGTTLLYSTYLGATGSTTATGIAVDSSGEAYITGFTGGGYPTTGDAYQPKLIGGVGVFVSKFNSTGTALLYSTYLDGGATDEGSGIAVDSSSDAYVTGFTDGGYPSSRFPTTSGAYQTSPGGQIDAFVSKLMFSTATAVKLMSFTATRYSHTLWLTWQTGWETDNLGFNVYREVRGKKVRLNGSNLIAGSALQMGTQDGFNYAWPDTLQAGAKYWLEDVDTHGKSTWHGPITPRVSSGSPVGQRRSPLLGQM